MEALLAEGIQAGLPSLHIRNDHQPEPILAWLRFSSQMALSAIQHRNQQPYDSMHSLPLASGVQRRA